MNSVSLFMLSYNLATALYLSGFSSFLSLCSLLDTIVAQMPSVLFLKIFHGQFVSLSLT